MTRILRHDGTDVLAQEEEEVVKVEIGMTPFLYIHDGTDVLAQEEEEVMAVEMGMTPFLSRHDGYRRVAIGRGGGGDAEDTISIQT